MAVEQQFGLGAVLAIAITLGATCLAALLALFVVALRLSCVATRERRETRAWISAQSEDYRRRSASTAASAQSKPHRSRQSRNWTSRPLPLNLYPTAPKTSPQLAGLPKSSPETASLPPLEMPFPPQLAASCVGRTPAEVCNDTDLQTGLLPPEGLAEAAAHIHRTDINGTAPGATSRSRLDRLNVNSPRLPLYAEPSFSPPSALEQHSSESGTSALTSAPESPLLSSPPRMPATLSGQAAGVYSKYATPETPRSIGDGRVRPADSSPTAAAAEDSNRPWALITSTPGSMADKEIPAPDVQSHTKEQDPLPARSRHSPSCASVSTNHSDRKTRRILNLQDVPLPTTLPLSISQRNLQSRRQAEAPTVERDNGDRTQLHYLLRRDKELQERSVVVPSYARGHTSVTSYAGSFVSSTTAGRFSTQVAGGTFGSNGTGVNAHDTVADRTEPLTGVSEASTSFTSLDSTPTDMTRELFESQVEHSPEHPAREDNHQPQLSLPASLSSSSRSSSLASSYGTAQLPQGGGSSIRNIASLQLNYNSRPRYRQARSTNSKTPGSPKLTNSLAQKKLHRRSTDAFGSRSLQSLKSKKTARLNKPLPQTPHMGSTAGPGTGVVTNLNGVQFQTISSYSPQLSDELELHQGDIVKVYQIFDDGWCLGRVIAADARGSRQGICPKACLVRID